ncbi:hypothetical protein ACRJ4W_03380 [Streptomyces sp. GLT-R25]
MANTAAVTEGSTPPEAADDTSPVRRSRYCGLQTVVHVPAVLRTAVFSAIVSSMSAKQNRDDLDPDVQRILDTRAEIMRVETQLAQLRQQLEDHVRAAVTPPAGGKLPYGRVTGLARMLGYKDSSMIYTLRDNSLARARQRLPDGTVEDRRGKPTAA